MSKRRRRGFAVPKPVQLSESAPVIDEVDSAVEADSAKPGSDRQLRRYWTKGEGSLKIKWGTPNDFDRCVRHLSKYVADPKGLCAEYHHEALGAWPGHGHGHGSKESTTTAAAGPAAVHIAEAGVSGDITPAAASRRYRARLIEGDRWGSSGWYSRDVLERDGWIFEGAQIFADHPGAAEESDRPERSIRDLAGRIATTPVYDGDGLYAEVEIFPHMAPMVEALADTVGLSIRAAGLAETGTVNGRTGPVITELTEAYSVDLVTRAGAGGKLVSLLESARTQHLTEARNVAGWLESRLHLALTQLGDDMYGEGRLTRDERITLSSAIGDALSAWTARVEADAPQLFQRDLYIDPEPVMTAVAESAELAEPPKTLAGAPPAANPTIQEEPRMSGAQTAGVAPGAQAGHTPTAGAADGTPDIIVTEAKRQVAELRLTEAQRLNETLTAQLTEARQATATAEARAVAAETDLRRVRAAESARTAAVTALAGTDLPQVAHTKVIESVTRGVTLTESGEVDTAALTASVTAAIEAERTYIASVSQQAGTGTPTGLGSTPAPLTESASDAGDWEAATAARLARIGGYKTTAVTAGKAS